MQETDSAKQHVLEKFKKRGFNHLTLEDLAITQITPNWSEIFKAAVSEDWSLYQEKASERLARAKFNIKWLTRENNAPLNNLFSIVTRGDLKILEEYIRVNDLKACINAVDDSKKTALHIAAREGHANIVEYLVNKGWSIEARDKLLSTPLHMCCNSGYDNIISYLLLKGADPRAKDTLGRNSLLFSVCSPSSEAVQALLKKDVTLLETRDYTGRTALHYAIFNPHPRQVDIIRTLIEAGISSNVTDSELKTPLHHACEASKPRSIRILLKSGADTNLKDQNGKTPIDLASNQNIKQLITLYTQSKPEPIKSSRLSSEKLPKLSNKTVENKNNVQSSTTTSVFKDKLLALLRKVQESGANSNQHIKKPSIYSGSWVENIVNVAALHNELESSSPSEAVIKVFNVLFPYPKPLPVPQDDDTANLDFFGVQSGYKVPKHDPIYIQDDGKLIRLQQQLESAEQNIRDLQQHISSKDSVIQELQNALKAKSSDISNLQSLLQEVKEKHQTALKLIPSAEESKNRLQEKQKLTEQIESLKKQLEDSEKRNKDIKLLAETLKTELDQRPSKDDVEELKQNIEKIQADDRNLRYKAGAIFLEALDNDEENDPYAPQVHLHDDEVLKRLETALKGNPPSFKQRLMDADTNKDGKITKGELAKLFGSLSLPPQDLIVLLRISGFRRGVPSISIDTVAAIVSSREQKKENLENLLFSKLSEIFRKSSVTVEQAFEYLDVNKDGSVNFQELSNGCDLLKLNLSREDKYALFAVLDSDHNGSISLDELRIRLETAQAMPKPLNPVVPKQPSPIYKPSSDKLPNSRYQEPKEITPISSKNSEVNFDKEPIKPTSKETDKTKELTKINIKKINGSLVIGVVKAKDLGPGNLFVNLHIEGAEKSLKTPVAPGPSPEWKFIGRVRLYDTGLNAVSSEVIAEVNNDKGIIGSSKVLWTQSLDFPNAWAIKSEYPVLESNGRKKGSVVIHLMWVPKDSIRIEGSGTLSIQTISFSGFPKSLLQFTIGDNSVLAPLQKDYIARIKDLLLKNNSAVPSLKCSILNATNKEVILWRNLSIEIALAARDWTQPLQVPLNDGYQLSLKFLWQPQSAEQEKLIRSAIKIQAMFRGLKARREASIKKKINRKIVSKKVLKYNKKYYLLVVLEQEDKYLLELHVANDLDTPMYEVISSLLCPQQAVEDIYKAIKISDDNVMTIETQEIEINGSLGIEICNSTCTLKNFVRFEIGSAFVHSPAGPPWTKKFMLQQISSTQTGLLKITIFNLENRQELAHGSVEWGNCRKTPDRWTEETTYDVDKFKVTLKLLWTQSKPVQKVQLDKVEEKIVKKTTRKLIARRGLMRNKRYFLVSVYEKTGLKEIELHVADDPSFPMYQVVDKCDINPLLDLETALNKLEISKDRKLILPKNS